MWPLGLWSIEVSDRTAGRPGDVIAVRWVWEALASPDTALEATLALLGPHNTVIRGWALPLWQPGGPRMPGLRVTVGWGIMWCACPVILRVADTDSL